MLPMVTQLISKSSDANPGLTQILYWSSNRKRIGEMEFGF